jgi:hypothetical protein
VVNASAINPGGAGQQRLGACRGEGAATPTAARHEHLAQKVANFVTFCRYVPCVFQCDEHAPQQRRIAGSPAAPDRASGGRATPGREVVDSLVDVTQWDALP